MSEMIGFIGLGQLGMRSTYTTARRAKPNRWLPSERKWRANPLTQ